MNEFISQQSVQDAVKIALEKKQNNTRYSDISDAQGNQYVDLVQEGGGVLGIALVGYTYVLENAGIRFFNLAGTSAGAINTMMIAGMGKIGDPVSEKILKVLSEKYLFEMVDGDEKVKKLIKKAVSGEGGLKWFLAWNGLKIWKILKTKLGLNPGNDFVEWITKVLKDNNIRTVKDLEEHRKHLPTGLKAEDNSSVSNLEAKLAIIASDISTNTKVDFPRMAKLYYKDPENMNPALMVRTSMSVPYFFEPFIANNLPNAGTKNNEDWKKMASYSGEVPKKARFVDGGMLSNFPINVFHRKDGGVPRMPTFGVRLSTYRDSYNNTDSIMGMSGAMISTMRQIFDYDFLLKNPDYNQLICKINADASFNWLNFDMTPQKQQELFALGATKAAEFLNAFSWEKYKETRRRLALANEAAK